MRHPAISAVVLLLAITGGDGICQVGASAGPTTQFRKAWELDRRAAADLEKRDGIVNDAATTEYLQKIADRLLSSAVAKPVRISLTRGADLYALPLSTRVVYISAGLLERLADEAELAGLIAHDLVHLANGSSCVLAPQAAVSLPEASREGERLATEGALLCLKASEYDPANLLGLLSKLAYEHPSWAKAIVSDDLLDLRAKLESETMPPAGYKVDSSGFIQLHRRVEAMPTAVRAK